MTQILLIRSDDEIGDCMVQLSYMYRMNIFTLTKWWPVTPFSRMLWFISWWCVSREVPQLLAEILWTRVNQIMCCIRRYVRDKLHTTMTPRRASVSSQRAARASWMTWNTRVPSRPDEQSPCRWPSSTTARGLSRRRSTGRTLSAPPAPRTGNLRAPAIATVNKTDGCLTHFCPEFQNWDSD